MFNFSWLIFSQTVDSNITKQVGTSSVFYSITYCLIRSAIDLITVFQSAQQLNYMNIFRDDGAIDLLSRIFQELYPKANIINTFFA